MSAWQEYKKNLGNTRPWDMLNPSEERATDDEAAERYSICLGCPELIKMTKQCRKCGCLMFAKTQLKKAECPIGKW